MRAPPPLRFLVTVLGGWACLRIVMLWPGWTGEAAGPIREAQAAQTAQVAPAALRPATLTGRSANGLTFSVSPAPCRSCRAKSRHLTDQVNVETIASERPSTSLGTSVQMAMLELYREPREEPVQTLVRASQAAAGPRAIQQVLSMQPVSRWSASAWAFVRQGGGEQLAPGGMLGGSQAGARLGYRINADPARPLALNARLYTPLKNRKAAEAAVGAEWKPVAEVPVRLLAERRQALGREGRSAFSLLMHGGVSGLKVAGPVELNAYAQAGVVGMRSRDLFADGSVTLGLPIDGAERITIGAGAWGAAQPGISRLDAGPSVSLRLPLQGRNIRISAGWRLKIAGDASPGSGPALTIGSDF